MQIPKLVSPDEFQTLYKDLDNRRDKLIIILLYGTGCGVGELVSTRVKDVDLQEGLIHLQAARTKTRQYRFCGGTIRCLTTARDVDPEPAEKYEVAHPRPGRRPYHRSAG